VKNSQKKIVLISTEFPPEPGGIGMHAWSLAKSLAARNTDVHVITDITAEIGQPIHDFDRKQPFTIYRVKRKVPFVYIHRIRSAIQVIRKIAPDAILVSGKFPLWTGAILKKLGFKVPVIGILHGSEINPSNGVFRWLTHSALKVLTKLVVVSTFSERLIPDEILKQKPVRVIPNGVELKEFLNAPWVAPEKLKGSPTLLTIGNMTKRKGQHRVIRALPTLSKYFPDIHYHCIGIPSRAEELKTLARQLGVENRITLHGKIEDRMHMFALASTADVFIMLSENQPDGDVEGYGIAILEANAIGIPAIGAKGSGINDAIESGYNGLLVNGDSHTEVEHALKEILKDRNRYAINARMWASQHDWDTIVIDYTNFIFEP
jgi:phosphatidylinositol alpha-1,6-mannosyltransferase